MKSKPLMRIEEVHRTFEMGDVSVHVLKGISLDIFEGELLSIVGPSGSGKSTLLNLIGGMDLPSDGNVWFEDEKISHATPGQLTRYRRDKIGFVFQFYNLVPNLTAVENVRVATEICADPMDASKAIELVDLSDRADHFPAQLSGGEQQRVAIARAIAKRPRLLLCDEPTGALDFHTGKLVLRTLVDLNQQLGMTVVIITHNSALANVTRRVIHLRDGVISDAHTNEHPVKPEEVVW